ncbi:hypothetical protein ScPMuIL_001294 [Solemya velum]
MEVPKNNIQNGEIGFDGELNGNTSRDESLDAFGMMKDSSRIIKKAKRPSKQSPGRDVSDGEEAINGVATNLQASIAFTKNSRKSRNARGRGLPKKGGAGGKGTWGAPGDELFADGLCRDSHDPNYDSDNQGEYIVEKIVPEISEDDFKRLVTPLILEYYENEDTHDVQESLCELSLGKNKSRLVELAINLALDRKATHCEKTSRLISDMYGSTLSPADISQGFHGLLGSLSDLSLDAPEAPSKVGQFIARAVADDCLAPKFINSYKGNVEGEHMRAALDKAELLLSQKHGIVRLDSIWGTGGGTRPVKYLVNQMILLLKEYLSSGDIAEATRCLKDLEVPHFHHELVYEATVIVMEDSSERAAQRMSKFFKSLHESAIITPEQMTQGFVRVFDALPDISLDVPSAYALLERFANICYKDGFVSTSMMKDLPQRGRKRFVSEGDGGVVKEVIL